MNYREFCLLFTEDVPSATQVGDRYYLVGEDLASFKSGEQRKPHGMGLYLGMGKGFVPSLALLRILTKSSTRTARVLTEKAEWLFICGRDVLLGNFETGVDEGFVLVINTQGENLGLGKIFFSKQGLIIKNILDRGNYLRHEKVNL